VQVQGVGARGLAAGVEEISQAPGSWKNHGMKYGGNEIAMDKQWVQ